ncbi:MAG: hypothetical protein L0323_20065 [Planctomycetes bacterium]|nr:hypothetical protein [Planctomycetota bacterium]
MKPLPWFAPFLRPARGFPARALLLLAPVVAAALCERAGAQPCAPPIMEFSYRVLPTDSGFASIEFLPGTVVELDAMIAPFNDVTTPLVTPPGFVIAYFGIPSVDFAINANGWLAFPSFGAPPAPGPTPQSNGHLGNPAVLPNNMVCPFWEDLVGLPTCFPGAKVMWLYPAPDGSCTVEWKGVEMHLGAGAGEGTCFSFQAKLFPAFHPFQPNEIEFRYDMASPPPAAIMPCAPWLPVGTAANSYFAVSATIGLEDYAGFTGVEATERGAGNPGFPPYGVRFVPAIFDGPDMGVPGAYVVTPGPGPLMHIEGLVDTVEPLAAGAGWCAGVGACYDDDNSARNLGVLSDLPWKVNLYGRFARNFNLMTNGYVGLGQGTFRNFFDPGVVGVAEPNLALFAGSEDWQGIAPSDECGAPSSSIFYRVDGLPGARVVTFEWHDGHPYTGPGCSAAMGHCSFQARIYEAGAAAGGLAVAAGCPAFPPFVFPGVGDDAVEFLWSGACTAPPLASLIENWNGATSHAAGFGPGAGTLFTPCPWGLIHYYGDPSMAGLAAACLPEIRGNNVPPVIGNAEFGVSLVRATPGGFAVLMVSVGAFAGLGIPVPPGGITFPGLGTFWVGLPLATMIPLGVTFGAGPCLGYSTVTLPIPPDPALIGGVVFAQIGNLVPAAGISVELTEGMKIVIGG